MLKGWMIVIKISIYYSCVYILIYIAYNYIEMQRRYYCIVHVAIRHVLSIVTYQQTPPEITIFYRSDGNQSSRYSLLVTYLNRRIQRKIHRGKYSTIYMYIVQLTGQADHREVVNIVGAIYDYLHANVVFPSGIFGVGEKLVCSETDRSREYSINHTVFLCFFLLNMTNRHVIRRTHQNPLALLKLLFIVSWFFYRWGIMRINCYTL